MIRIKDIKIREDLLEEKVLEKALQKNRLQKEDVKKWYIYKKSIDARKKEDIFYNYTIDIELKDKNKEKKFEKIEEYKMPEIKVKRTSKIQPVIIGAGPAGLFSALIFVENGIKPILIERGKRVEDRVKDVEEFINNRKFNPKSNIQFGEGGAGTFSDGKLNTGNSSIYSRKVLEEFVKFGAPKEIMYVAKPHLGTDNLVKIVKNIREYILEKGGQIFFEEEVIDFEIKKGQIKSVITNQKRKIETDSVILAIGHSARDTFRMLNKNKIKMEPKPFAVGVRVQHPQEKINYSQYGNFKDILPPAAYKLTYHSSNGRGVYSFCMCPGGYVVNASSEDRRLAINGMSNHSRDSKNANSAIVVTVIPNDFNGNLFGGLEFQEKLEEKTYKIGEGKIPIQTLKDFMENKKTEKIGSVELEMKGDYSLANLNEILPDYIAESLKEAFINFDKKIKGFSDGDTILAAIETRTSSPVRILRDELGQSNIKGIYPAGEGAGYAGGIMSAAMDGLKVAESIAKIYWN